MLKKRAKMALALLFVASVVFLAGCANPIPPVIFKNNTGHDVNDLHVNILYSTALLDPATAVSPPFTYCNTNQDGSQLDCGGGTVAPGGSVTIDFRLIAAEPPVEVEWWWTWNGEQRGKKKRAIIRQVPSGGGRASIPSASNEATVDFPPGALPEETVVALSIDPDIPNPTSVPQGFLPIRKALDIELEPNPGTLPVPATVTIPYTDEEIGGYNEASLRIFRYDDNAGQWNVIPSTVNTADNVVTFETDHFSIYGIGGDSLTSGPVPSSSVWSLILMGFIAVGMIGRSIRIKRC